MNLGFNIVPEDMTTQEGLKKIDHAFHTFLKGSDETLYGQYQAALTKAREDFDQSQILTKTAPYLETFLYQLFNIQGSRHLEKALHAKDIFQFKRQFLQRRVLKTYTLQDIDKLQIQFVKTQLTKFFGEPLTEISFYTHVNAWVQTQKHSPDNHDLLNKIKYAERFAAWALLSHEGQKVYRHSFLFSVSQTQNFDHLFPVQKTPQGFSAKWTSPRRGFDLTDPGGGQEEALQIAHYCLICHTRGKDSCRKGCHGPSGVQKNPLGDSLTGCPLDQKISEMLQVYRQGFPIGALAIVMIDNPLCAATGHRICNDCSKACIFQKQTPVDVPRAETQILKEVLSLGVEIYTLLALWNPLNFDSVFPQPAKNYKICIAGQGPAGFSLAYFLLKKGYHVTGLEALNIKTDLRFPFPVETLNDLTPYHDIDDFGGVMTYGITARWDKRYLTLIRLILSRFQRYQIYGNTRLGSTVTTNQVFEQGYDHLSLCLGAGRPNIPDIENVNCPGVRQAADVLMNIHLNRVGKGGRPSLSLELPLVVIGGGLTAVDAATEARAYYKEMCQDVYRSLGPSQFKTFYEHGKALSQAATEEDRDRLIDKWGGVTLVYRRHMQTAPSYRKNAYELQKAMEEGIGFYDESPPTKIEKDATGKAVGITFKDGRFLAAKTILLATGTHPNTMIAHEEKWDVTPEGYFEPIPSSTYFLTNQISFLGDLHPDSAGSVVKAIAAAKSAAKDIDTFFTTHRPLPRKGRGFQKPFFQQKTVIDHPTASITQFKVKAPSLCLNYLPGQFYKAQVRGYHPIALTPSKVTGETLTFLTPTHSRVGHALKNHQEVTFMGPCGTPEDISAHEDVLCLGEGFAAFSLQGVATAFKAEHNTVFVGFVSPGPEYALLSRTLRAASHHFSTAHTLSEVINSLPTFPGQKIYIAGSAAFIAQAQAHFPRATIRSFVHAPMQCMMKAVCGACVYLAKHPTFGCAHHIQNSADYDPKNLEERGEHDRKLRKAFL